MFHLCTILRHSKNTPSPCLSVEVVANLEAGGWRCNGNARCPLVDVNRFYVYWAAKFKAEYPITILAVLTHNPSMVRVTSKERKTIPEYTRITFVPCDRSR